MRLFILGVLVLPFLACSTTKSGGNLCYSNTKTILGIQWEERLIISSSLNLKRGNYFQYYQQLPTLLPSIPTSKVVEYKGSYEQSGDTILLRFCGDTIPRQMTKKMRIDTSRKRIVYLSVNPTHNQSYEMKILKR